MLSVLALLSAVAAASAGQVTHAKGALRRDAGRPDGFVKSLEFKHRLRVCNAYPYSAALDVYRGKNEKLTDAAMPYKGCKDFLSPLKAGDKLEFKVGDASAGTFSISDLPNNDAVLLLVIHRHDTLSTAVSFESHVFANLLNAQVAIIDTYKGSAKALPRIMDVQHSGKNGRSEELRYDSVVAVNPGMYNVVLAATDGSVKAKGELVALNRESYVVMRTGVESAQGPSYPQELVVYPQSELPPIKSGASAVGVSAALLALAASLMVQLA